MAHDVFVSHSSKDKPTADAVCAMLESQGIRCWVAPRDITPGMDWGEAIVHAVKGARVMVLVFSKSANDSPQIKREVERAVNKGIPVIPLRIEDVAPTASLEYFISTPHWLDAFTPPLETHLRYLAQIIHQITGAQRTKESAALPTGPVPSAPPVETPAQNQTPPKEEGRRRIPAMGVFAGTAALMAILLAGWWFGIERPKRDEARRKIANERAMQAQAKLESLRIAEEQRKLQEEMAAKLTEQKQQAALAAAKFAEEKRLADAARMALEKQNEEAAAKLAEAQRRTEAEAAKAAAEKKAEDLVLIKPRLAQNDDTTQVPSPKPPVLESGSPKRSPTVFDLIKEANLSVGADSKDKIVSASSEKSAGELAPSNWNLVLYDPTATWKAVQVSFRAGQKVGVSYPARIIERLRADQFFDKSKLKVDSDQALQIVMQEPILKPVGLKASQMSLELRNGSPVWRIRLWAAKYGNRNAQADIGEMQISADEGKVIKRDLHPERLN